MALCLSVCLSQVGVLLKRLDEGSHKQTALLVRLVVAAVLTRNTLGLLNVRTLLPERKLEVSK